MGIHIGVPHFVKAAVNDAKQVGGEIAHKAVETGKHLVHDGFDAANAGFKHLTSSKDKGLVKKELELAHAATDPTKSKAEREAARAEMRKAMGAEPLDKLDPLPATASAQAEKARSAKAKLWDPAKEPPSTKMQWATNDAGGKKKSDPVNLYVHGNLSDIVRAFQKGGWSIADAGADGPKNYTNAMKKYAEESAEGLVPGMHGVTQGTYHAVNKMPVGNLYMNGQLPVVSMEANNHPLTGRDHFRIFFTGKKDAQGQNIYAVTASRDEGIALDPKRKKTAFTNHFTEKNADAERDFTLKTLQAGGAQVAVRETRRDGSGGPQGGLFSGDGKVYDLTVK